MNRLYFATELFQLLPCQCRKNCLMFRGGVVRNLRLAHATKALVESGADAEIIEIKRLLPPQ